MRLSSAVRGVCGERCPSGTALDDLALSPDCRDGRAAGKTRTQIEQSCWTGTSGLLDGHRRHTAQQQGRGQQPSWPWRAQTCLSSSWKLRGTRPGTSGLGLALGLASSSPGWIAFEQLRRFRRRRRNSALILTSPFRRRHTIVSAGRAGAPRGTKRSRGDVGDKVVPLT